jgi:hypothetical protein
MGIVVVFGSLAATFIGIFLTPALFVIVQTLTEKMGGKRPTPPPSEDQAGELSGGHA